MTQYQRKNTDIEKRQRQVNAVAEAGERPVPSKGRKKISHAKKRARIDKMISLKMSLIFFAFMLLIAILLLVVPRSTISNIEKRNLAEWPSFSLASYFSGDYTSGITEFYDDTVPARDSFKNLGYTIKSLFGISSADTAEVIGNVTKRDTETTEETTEEAAAEGESSEEETTTEAETEEETNKNNYTLANADATLEDGILVVYQDGHYRALALSGVGYESLYCDVVNEVRASISDDVNIYFMPVPLAAQYYLPANYSDYSVDQKSVFQEYMDNMDSGITCIDIIDVLDNHNAEPIYLRTDHHWAPLGAYYAAREFANAAGVPFADLDTYRKIEREGYVGTMYSFTESANILNDPETFVYYQGTTSKYVVDYYDEAFSYSWTGSLFFDTDISSSYCSYLGSDQLIAKITTDVNNGRKLLVIKDSYGNAQIPFYTASFEEIYVIDQRYFDLNLINFINYTGVTDVLFTHNTFALIGAEAELLQWITENNWDAAIYDEADAAEPTALAPETDDETETEED